MTPGDPTDITVIRSHLTRDTAAMFTLFQNPVAPTEHECRDPYLPAVSHIENAEEEGRSVVLGLPKLYSVYSNHHDDSSCGTISTTRAKSRKPSSPYSGGLTSATIQSEYEGKICPEQSDRNSIPTGTGDGKDVPDHEIIGGEIGVSRWSMKTGQKNACWVASKRQ